MITLSEFKMIYEIIPGETEFRLSFRGDNHDYMIVKYDDCVTFQRCGYEDESDEIEYTDISELLSSDLVDDINLTRDWSKIEDIVADSTFNLALDADLDWMRSVQLTMDVSDML